MLASRIAAVSSEEAARYDDAFSLLVASAEGRVTPGSDLLIGYATCGAPWHGPRIVQAVPIEFALAGNEISVRVRIEFSAGAEPSDGGRFVRIELPRLDPGRFYATVSFDEWCNGSYCGAASETLFTSFVVE